MKEHKVIIGVMTEHMMLHRLMSRLQRAYEIFGSDERLLREVEGVLDTYRKLKKESESEK